MESALQESNCVLRSDAKDRYMIIEGLIVRVKIVGFFVRSGKPFVELVQV